MEIDYTIGCYLCLRLNSGLLSSDCFHFSFLGIQVLEHRGLSGDILNQVQLPKSH